MSRARRRRHARRRGAGPRHGFVPLSSVARQAASDIGPLSVGLVVTMLVAFMAAVVPRFSAEAEGDEVRAAVADRAAGTDVVVSVPLSYWRVEPRTLQPGTADQAHYLAEKLATGLPDVFASPVTEIASRSLKAGVIDLHPVIARFAYVSRDEDAGVTWVSGDPPGLSERLDGPDGGFGPVEVGVSEAAASLLGLTPGSPLALTDPNGGAVAARVSGVYAAVDPQDQRWSVAPRLLGPKVIDGSVPRIDVDLLLTAESVPFALVSLDPGMFSRSFTFRVEPERLDASNAADVATAIRSVTARPDAFEIPLESPSVRTRLDAVIDDALVRVRSANAQASLILAGVLGTALLVLVLASELVVQRRSRVLTHQRSHGASLPAIARGLAIESTTLAALGWGVGLALAARVVPGPLSWGWVLPPLVLTLAASPVLGVRAAARRSAPPPARRLDARSGMPLAAIRRLAGEGTVLVLAVGALAGLRSRGATAAGDTLGSDLIVLAAPTLAACAVALALARLLPPVWTWVRAFAGRSRSAVPVLAAARLRAAVLPLTSLVLATTLLTVALAMEATARSGELAGSWESVGADAVVTYATMLSGLPPELLELGAQDGVDAAASASVFPGRQVLGTGVDTAVRFAAVDSAGLERLFAVSPLADAPQLEALTSSWAVGDPIPALTFGLPKGASGLTVPWGDEQFEIVSVGVAPSLPGDPPGLGPAVIVDRAVLGEATGVDLPADLAWFDGSGAATALRASTALGNFDIVTRDDWLTARRTAPVTRAFGVLLVASAAVLLVARDPRGGARQRREREREGHRSRGLPRPRACPARRRPRGHPRDDRPRRGRGARRRGNGGRPRGVARRAAGPFFADGTARHPRACPAVVGLAFGARADRRRARRRRGGTRPPQA